MQTKIAWLGVCLAVWGCGGGGTARLEKTAASRAMRPTRPPPPTRATAAREPMRASRTTGACRPTSPPPTATRPPPVRCVGRAFTTPTGCGICRAPSPPSERWVTWWPTCWWTRSSTGRASRRCSRTARARLVHDLIASKVKAAVDQSAPAQLKPDSELMRKLGIVLASTEVKSTIDIGAGQQGRRRARPRRNCAASPSAGRTRKSTVTVGDLLQRTVPLVTVGADWRGRESTDATLAIDQHAFELRLGQLMLWVLDNVLLEQGGASLSQTAASLVNCAAITAALLDGKTEFSFGVGLRPTRSAPATLQDGCQRGHRHGQGQGTGPVRHGRRGRAGRRGRGAGRRRRPHRRPPEEQGRLWGHRDQVGAGGAGAAGDRAASRPGGVSAPRTPARHRSALRRHEQHHRHHGAAAAARAACSR